MIAYRWVIVLLCFSLLFMVTGVQMTFAILLVPMSLEFHASVSDLAIASSISMLVTGVSLPIVGRIVDKRGPRIVILVGATIAGLSTLLLAFVSSIWEIYLLYGFLFGFTWNSSSMVASTALVSRWFARKSTAMTIFQSGYSMGWLFMVPLVESLRQSYGWRSSWFTLGAAYLLTILFMCLLLKEPDKSDTQMDRDSIVATVPLRRAAKTSFFLIVGVVIMFICGFTDVPFLILWIPMSLEWGIGEGTASYTLGFMALMVFLGTITIGPLPGRFGKKLPFTISYVIRAVALVVPLILRSTETYYAFAFLMAFSFYGMVPVISAWLGEVFGQESVGSLFGFSLFMHFIGTAAGVYCFSLLAETYKTYYLALVLGFILTSVSVVSALLTGPVAKTNYLDEPHREAGRKQKMLKREDHGS